MAGRQTLSAEAGGQIVVDPMILRRKIQASRRIVHLESIDSAARAWRVSFGRAAMETLGLHLEVSEVRDTQRKLGELTEIVPERALVALLEGPEGLTGILALSNGLISAMIEMQTMRSVSKSEPPVRRPTRTDAMMSTEMINAALSDLGAELVHSQDVRWSAGFVYASFVEEAGTLDLMLEDVAYRLLECTLQIGTTKRTGRVLLALPAEGRGPRPRPRRDASEPDIRAAEAWTADVCETVMHVEAPIEGVVGRIRMPLNKILSLGLDDVLPIENGGVDNVSLEAAGGTRIALCRLGQNRGMRALRLRNIEDPNHSSFGAIPHMPDAPAPDLQKATLSQSARTKASSTAESASS